MASLSSSYGNPPDWGTIGKALSLPRIRDSVSSEDNGSQLSYSPGL